MHAPYTDRPAEAFQVAQIAAGALLSLVGSSLLAARSRPTRYAWLGAVWLAALAPSIAWGLSRLGVVGPLAFDAYLTAACIGLAVASLGARSAWSRGVLLGALVVVSCCHGRLQDFEREWAAAHLLLAGVVLGFLASPGPSGPSRSAARNHGHYGTQDLVLVVLGTFVASLIADLVLWRGANSGDEWAYTYQAAVYAKGHMYGKTPACLESLRMFWVFWRDDRMFAQYQPGWPLFLVPFVWCRAVWLGGPLSFGLLSMATARLTRAVFDGLPGVTHSATRRAGWFGGLTVLLAMSPLLNGASRYPHVFVAALFAGGTEVTLRLGRLGRTAEATRLGAVLGVLLGWLLLTRAPDAVLLSVGPVTYLGVAVVRRRTSWRVVLATLGGSLPFVAFLLWSAHVQVGGWGVLPYALTTEFHPWARPAFSIPAAHLWKWSLPFATGAYCWFPLTPALGAAGLLLCWRARALRAVAWTLGLSSSVFWLFYALVEYGRGADFGYGPRYFLAFVVPMAVGTAVTLERAVGTLAPRRRQSLVSGVVVICGVAACLLGAELLPGAQRLLGEVMAVQRAVDERALHDAVVVVGPDAFPYGPMDVTRNLPLELYDAPAILANESDLACLRREYPNRTFYRAVGRGAQLVPMVP